jgi:hypothetical protein
MPLPSHYNTSTNTKHTSRQLAPQVPEESAKKEHQTSSERAQLDDNPQLYDNPQLEVVLSTARLSKGERRTRDLGGQALPDQKGHGGADVRVEIHCGLEVT